VSSLRAPVQTAPTVERVALLESLQAAGLPVTKAREGGGVTCLELLQDVLARIVAAREAADPDERTLILADLEADLASWLEQQRAT
jgi:hypothetical protein